MALPLTVSDEVRALAPGVTYLAAEAHGLVGGPGTEVRSPLLDDAARRLAVRLERSAPHEAPHMAAWRSVYTASGAEPSRTRNSTRRRRRALSDAGLPRINLLADVHNAVGVAHLIRVGGEDLDRVRGGMRLVRATGDEGFGPSRGDGRASSVPTPARWCGVTRRV